MYSSQPGAELKLTFGLDSKLEAFRIFIDKVHPKVNPGGGGLSVVIAEIAITSSFQYGLLVLTPVVGAGLLLFSFGCTHLTLSILGHNEADTEADGDENVLEGGGDGNGDGRQSYTWAQRCRRRICYVCCCGCCCRHAREAGHRFYGNAMRSSATRAISEEGEHDEDCKTALMTMAYSALDMISRWWLLLIVIGMAITAINSTLVGRGWSYSLATCKRSASFGAFQGLSRALSSVWYTE